MKEFYAEEYGQDYGVLCFQEQIRQSVTKEILDEVLNLEIEGFHIDFENEIIEYEYTEQNSNLFGNILIDNFIEKCYELGKNE